jgi:hypothetical protein
MAPCNQAFRAEPLSFATQEICQNMCLREKTGLIADQRLTWVGNPSVNDAGSPPVVDFVRSGEFRPPQRGSIFSQMRKLLGEIQINFPIMVKTCSRVPLRLVRGHAVHAMGTVEPKLSR